MSLGLIRPYYRDKMETLGYEEWPDAFNTENIPSTNLNKAYHLGAGPISTIQLDQNSTDVSLEVIVSFFLRGFSDPIEALDDAHTEAQTIIETIMNVADRTTGDVKNIELNSGDFVPLNDTNDNSVLGIVSFENYNIICF